MNTENKTILVLDNYTYEMIKKGYRSYRTNRLNARQKNREKNNVKESKYSVINNDNIPENLEVFEAKLENGKLYPVTADIKNLTLN